MAWRYAHPTAPLQVQPAIQTVVVWERALCELERLLETTGLNSETVTIEDAKFVRQGARTIQRMSDAAKFCDPASLCQKDTRDGIAQAASRTRRLQEIGKELIERFGIATNQLPQSEELRALAAAATSLDMLDQSPKAARTEAELLRERAKERDRIEDVLRQLADCFELGTPPHESLATMEQAVELLNNADSDILSSRTDSLVALGACRILDRAETECINLRGRRDDIAKRFDLKVLRSTSTDELQRATGALNAARRPLLFDGAAKRAMQLHREVALVRSKRTPDEAAGELRELIEYREASMRLVEDDKIKRFLGSDWQGVDTDFTIPRRVAEWAADVFAKLAGLGNGRSEARNTLLAGNVEQLDEIRRIAADLPSNWTAQRTAINSSDARERASRLEELADDLQRYGLDGSKPFASAVDLATLTDEYRALAGEADGDDNIALVFPSQVPDSRTLDMVAKLADAMSAEDLSDDAWTQTASFLEHVGGVDQAHSTLDALLTSVSDAWQSCISSLQLDVLEFLDGVQHDATALTALRKRARQALDARDTLLSWSAYQRARKLVKDSHAAPVLTALDKHRMSAQKLRNAYEWALYRSLTTIVYRQHPKLNQLDTWQLNNHRKAFQDLETRLQELERQRICYELYSRRIEKGIDFGGPRAFTEKALVQHQLSLQRSNVTLRDLLHRAGTALRQMKPCFMMSPRTVAELLPQDSQFFDIVIIDEASQMLPCDALGAIGRCRQAVIVGDPEQLPPSTYFEGSVGAALNNDDDDRMVSPMVESILDLSLSAWHPPRYLQWNYRSRHSSLIQFSNRRFYNNRLIVFPNPDENRERSGIRYHHVANGLCKNGENRIEAERIVDAACAFMKDPANRDLSLAIVAMNKKQRDLINDLMDHETAANRELERYRKRWRNTLYPFIVRNLETVQGDERDVVLISTVYGRATPGGPVLRRFGPITHPGGERRLNVLFSRARQRMEVFSSMQANEIAVGPDVSKGTRVLRDYLEYAATGRIETGISTGREPESPFEAHVLERLRDKGLDVDPQVGVAGFRIDLGIRHADYPHGYLLGVECDGRTYHSALSVRDRDRLREAVLRDLGWDIYRIWSTDWFQDADGQLKKLLEYIDSRIDGFRAASTVADDESVLPREVVATPAERRMEATTREELPKEPDDDAICVEVGDKVSYHEAGHELDIHQVTLVRGKDDPDNAIINDSKPLAIALLGAEIGETITVRHSTREWDIVVDRIERPESEVSKPAELGASASVEGVMVLPYLEWSGRATPHTAPPDDIAESLRAIVETEGPVLGNRVYQVYARASGIQRVDQKVRRVLNRAVAKLERKKLVVVEHEEKESGYRYAVLRCPNTEMVKVRQIGPRSFNEVPDSELGALIQNIRVSRPDDTSDEIYRQVLSIYGLVRMTEQVRKRFEKIEKHWI